MEVTFMIELPVGEFVRGVYLEGEPYAVFEDEEGAGALVFRDGVWVGLETADELIAVAAEGRAVSDADFESWVTKLSHDIHKSTNENKIDDTDSIVSVSRLGEVFIVDKEGYAYSRASGNWVKGALWSIEDMADRFAQVGSEEATRLLQEARDEVEFVDRLIQATEIESPNS